ncbi:hypothetical protein PPACK8108_LOCUS18880 [Phakopsora pachyrhizi]|uniref:Uncharacterized protein n=1 Tax=Phakopsora pachyrhizi TaxID=170000 RepID=A0AAV0BGH8_PHAPC|nr:hypothetical protein PPACK8108_LOCUS18880 [Phakopsora pachyrhizi]
MSKEIEKSKKIMTRSYDPVKKSLLISACWRREANPCHLADQKPFKVLVVAIEQGANTLDLVVDHPTNAVVKFHPVDCLLAGFVAHQEGALELKPTGGGVQLVKALVEILGRPVTEVKYLQVGCLLGWPTIEQEEKTQDTWALVTGRVRVVNKPEVHQVERLVKCPDPMDF